MTPNEQELWNALKDAREALCAAMRVIAEIDTGTLLDQAIPGIRSETAQQRFIDEIHALGIRNGFGVIIDNTLKKFTAHDRSV